MNTEKEIAIKIEGLKKNIAWELLVVERCRQIFKAG